MRDILNQIENIIKAAGYKRKDKTRGVSKTGLYWITVVTTQDTQNIRGTIGGGQLNVDRDIRINIDIEKSTNKLQYVDILEKQDYLISKIYPINVNLLTFRAGEISEDLNGDYVIELHFLCKNAITV